jgi:hypothetical protein
MLAGLGTMAAIAIRDPGFALEQNYYEKAVNYDAEIAQRAVNARLDWTLEPSLGAARAGRGTALALVVHEGSGVVRGAEVRVTAIRNASASRVLEAPLNETAPGEYRAELPLGNGGVWELRFSIQRGTDRFTQVVRRDVSEGLR